MNNKKISSFEIKKHNKFSWSYVYTIDGRKYDIHGGSTYDLRKKQLEIVTPHIMKQQKITKTAKLDVSGTLVPKNGIGIGINPIKYVFNERHA